MAESYSLSFDLPVATIRPFNTFGPRQSARAVIPTIITQALRGAKEIRLGSLDPVRDLTFVEDTADGFTAVAESGETAGEVTNVGNGSGIAIGGLARKVLDLIGSRAEIVTEDSRVRPPKSEVMKLVCDNRKAARLAGWAPRTSLETGLKKTIEFIGSHMDLYKPDIYNV
jgi:nucleoside-diphosphate-sugar epimerase